MKKALNILSVLLVKALLFFVSMLPYRSVNPLSKFLGNVFYRTNLRKKVIVKNWNYVFNKAISERELKGIYVNTARNFLETLLLFTSKSDTVLSLFHPTEQEDIITKHCDKDAVFVTMHYANWEVIGCYLAVKFKPFYPVYKKLSNQYFEDLMLDIRKKFRMYPVESRKIVKMVKKEPEKLYAFIIDQNLKQGRYYTFLDKETLITDVPVKLSLKNAKKIIYGYPVRDKDGIFTISTGMIDCSTIEYSQDNIDSVMQTICDCFSQQIKNDPIQWYGWLHKFWKNTPDNPKKGIY